MSLHAELSIAFPPFPPTPPGVEITPYKEFEEHGIRVEKDDNGQEVDGVGIPTAILPIYEEPDFDFNWDSEPFHRPAPPRSRSGDRGSWWEEWSEQDDKRVPIAFNPYVVFFFLRMPDHRALVIIYQQPGNNVNWTEFTLHFPAFEDLDVGHPNAMERQVQNISGVKYESR